jgi:hypothetical protein
MQSDRHERISERAYQIWVAEGRVHGMDEEHWRRAEREIADEERRIAAALAGRAAGAAQTTATPARRRPQTKPPSDANTAAPTRRGRRAPTGASSR